MDDWPSPSGLPDPTNRTAVEEWLTARSQEFADILARELNRVMVKGYDAFLATLPPQSALTAAGDLEALASIPRDWQMVVQATVVPHLEETYLMGSVSAFTQAPGTRRVSATRAAAWADVVNEQAVEYMGSAVNRMNDVGNTLWNDIRDRTARSIAAGATNEELKDQVQRLTQFSEYRADTIARTETNAAYINGDWAAAQALGEFGPVEKVWVASIGPRTRVDHAEAHDQTVPMADPFDVGGEAMMFPHDPNASAGNVVNCRCHVEFLYAGDERPDGTIVGDPVLAEQATPGAEVAPDA